MCGGRPSNRSARAHRIGGGVRCLCPAAKAVGRCPEVGGTVRRQRPRRRGAAADEGILRGVRNASRGWRCARRPACPVRKSGTQYETRRTPGSAAGCNTPAPPGDGQPLRWCETTRAAMRREWHPGTSRWRQRQRARLQEQVDGEAYRRIPREAADETWWFPPRGIGQYRMEASKRRQRPRRMRVIG